MQKAPPLSCCRFRITHRKSRFARVLRRLPLLSARCIPHSGRSRTSPLFCPLGEKNSPTPPQKPSKRREKGVNKVKSSKRWIYFGLSWEFDVTARRALAFPSGEGGPQAKRWWMRRAGKYSTKGVLLIRQPTSGCHLPRWGRHARSPQGEGRLRWRRYARSA